MIVTDRVDPVPSADLYMDALGQRFVSRTHQALLRAHRNAPDAIVKAGDLAAAMGWGDLGSANLHYGTLGTKVASHLGLTLPLLQTGPSKGKPFGIPALAEVSCEDGRSGPWFWRLYPEMVEALDRFGLG